MQFKKTLVRLLLILFPLASAAQTTYFPQDDKANILIERMEILNKTDSVLNFSKTKPISRKSIREWVNAGRHIKLASKVDEYNFHSLNLNNLEYLPLAEQAKYKSKKPFLKRFYTTPANLYEVHIKDFDLVINPVIQFIVSKESNNDETLYLNTRGLNLRGRIANKIGFYAYVTDNQEKDPLYVRDWVNFRKAVPGE